MAFSNRGTPCLTLKIILSDTPVEGTCWRCESQVFGVSAGTNLCRRVCHPCRHDGEGGGAWGLASAWLWPGCGRRWWFQLDQVETNLFLRLTVVLVICFPPICFCIVLTYFRYLTFDSFILFVIMAFYVPLPIIILFDLIFLSTRISTNKFSVIKEEYLWPWLLNEMERSYFPCMCH